MRSLHAALPISGTALLGVKAVVAESFERIHRSNLVGMGVLPLQFAEGTTRKTLNLDGSETVDFSGVAAGIRPRMDVLMRIQRASGVVDEVKLLCRIEDRKRTRLNSRHQC